MLIALNIYLEPEYSFPFKGKVGMGMGFIRINEKKQIRKKP